MTSERTVRTGVILLALFPLVAGAIALLAPATFFEEIGRYAPRNEHYVGDVGAFNAAYGAALLLAARRRSWRVPLLVLGAGWYGLHGLNHSFDGDEARSQARGVFDTVALAAGAALHLWLARLAGRSR